MTTKSVIDETFASFDANHDGFLTKTEAIKAAAEFSLDRYDTKNILLGLELKDKDRIPLKAFSEEVKSFCVCKFKKDPFREIFRRFDTDSSGELDYQEIRNAMGAFGIMVENSKVKQFFDNVDSNGDGRIDEDEYISFLASMRAQDLLSGFIK